MSPPNAHPRTLISRHPHQRAEDFLMARGRPATLWTPTPAKSLPKANEELTEACSRNCVLLACDLQVIYTNELDQGAYISQPCA